MPTNDNERQRSVKDDVSSSFPELRAHLDSKRNKTNIKRSQRPRPNIKNLKSSFWKRRKFTVGRLLGEGAFGQVYEATECTSGVTCALKVLSKQKFQSKQKREAIY
jgi:serine/threonine protein kinase